MFAARDSESGKDALVDPSLRGGRRHLANARNVLRRHDLHLFDLSKK
jgi:hypothetical protein